MGLFPGTKSEGAEFLPSIELGRHGEALSYIEIGKCNGVPSDTYRDEANIDVQLQLQLHGTQSPSTPKERKLTSDTLTGSHSNGTTMPNFLHNSRPIASDSLALFALLTKPAMAGNFTIANILNVDEHVKSPHDILGYSEKSTEVVQGICLITHSGRYLYITEQDERRGQDGAEIYTEVRPGKRNTIMKSREVSKDKRPGLIKMSKWGDVQKRVLRKCRSGSFQFRYYICFSNCTKKT